MDWYLSNNENFKRKCYSPFHFLFNYLIPFYRFVVVFTPHVPEETVLNYHYCFVYSSIYGYSLNLFAVGKKFMTSLSLAIWCRVLEIMKRDAEKDPQTNPNALHARRLISQVSFNWKFQTVIFLFGMFSSRIFEDGLI